MYTKKDLIRVLKQDIKTEINAINFYVDNIDDLNYGKNYKLVNELLFGSMTHLRIVAEELCRLCRSSSAKALKAAIERAVKEEEGMRAIYEYENNRTKEARLKKIFGKLTAQETHHKKLARSLK
ncbi:MAG: ferritin family protein [Candidatus Woesearchaeota archaeon]|nr:ferritin family protein [Candidatus Woesearchaeota archaeon]